MGKTLVKIMVCALALAGCAVDAGMPGSEGPSLGGKADGYEFGTANELLTDGNTSETAMERTFTIDVVLDSNNILMDRRNSFTRVAFRDASTSEQLVAEVSPSFETVDAADALTSEWDAWRANTPMQIAIMDFQHEQDPFSEESEAMDELERFLDAAVGSTVQFEVTHRVTRDTSAKVEIGGPSLECRAQFTDRFEVRPVSGLPDLRDLRYSIQPAFSDEDLFSNPTRRMMFGTVQVEGRVTDNLSIVPATAELEEEFVTQCGELFAAFAEQSY